MQPNYLYSFLCQFPPAFYEIISAKGKNLVAKKVRYKEIEFIITDFYLVDYNKFIIEILHLKGTAPAVIIGIIAGLIGLNIICLAISSQPARRAIVTTFTIGGISIIIILILIIIIIKQLSKMI